MNPIRVLVHGASGRMGQAVLAVSSEYPDSQVVAAVRRDNPLAGLPTFDVAIDFSLPPGLLRLAEFCAERRVALVSGTTGLDAAQQVALDRAAQSIPLLLASNFSVGVAALARAVGDLAARLDWDCEIIESHHAEKRDAPSGTALRLAAAINGGRGRSDAWVDRMQDQGRAREPGSVGIASLRGGRVVGDHSVHLLGPGERIELTHRADDRAIFARGAWLAARRLIARPPGRYSFEDVLWT